MAECSRQAFLCSCPSDADTGGEEWQGFDSSQGITVVSRRCQPWLESAQDESPPCTYTAVACMYIGWGLLPGSTARY